jgi:DHA3 family macrolide efflux protein-like MFS transporter
LAEQERTVTEPTTGFWRTPTAYVLLVIRTTSVAGDWLYYIASLWLVIQISGSSAAASLVAGAEAIPVILIAVFGGGVLDRGNRLRILAAVDALRCGIVLILPVLFGLNVLTVTELVLFGLVLAGLDAIFTPGLQSALPTLVRRDQLPAAHGMLDLTERFGRIVGPGLSGALLAVVPLIGFFVIDASTFLISAGSLLLLLRWTVNRESVATPRVPTSRRAPWRDLLDGLRYLRQEPVTRRILLVRTIGNLFWSSYIIGTPLLVAHRYSAGPGTWGTLIVAYALGQIAGNLAAVRFGGYRRPLHRLCLGWTITGIGFVALGLSSNVALGCAALVIAGVGGQLAHVSTDGYLATATSVDLQGRLFSLQFSGNELARLLGTVVFGIVLEFVSPVLTLVLAGLCMLALAAGGSVDKPTLPAPST